jgi:hypothetical protein
MGIDYSTLIVTNFLAAHWAVVTAVSAYVFLALVSAMPLPGDPRPVEQKVYDTIYTTLHVLANRVVVKYPPPANVPTNTTVNQ